MHSFLKQRSKTYVGFDQNQDVRKRLTFITSHLVFSDRDLTEERKLVKYLK
jgi:hypothetical protein